MYANNTPAFLGQTKISLLLVQAQVAVAPKFYNILNKLKHFEVKIQRADNINAAAVMLGQQDFDIMLVNIDLHQPNKLQELKNIQNNLDNPAIVVLVEDGDEFLAMQALQSGAQDYLLKSQTDRQLISRVLQYAIERKKVEKQIDYLKHYDRITGLYNRVFLQKFIKTASARVAAENTKLALMLIAIDNIQELSSVYGHCWYDSLVKKIAARIKLSLKKTAYTLVRFDDDKFALVSEQFIDSVEISSIAQQLLVALCKSFYIAKKEVFISVSIGISISNGDTLQIDEFIAQASTALGRARKMLGNNFQFYQAQMSADSHLRVMLSTSLRCALDNHEMRLFYQPQVEVNSGRIIGAEVLLRWQHPVAGNISPDIFIPLLEEAGLINSVGKLVLIEALQQRKIWLDHGVIDSDFKISINLSATQLASQDLGELISSIINQTQVPPELIEIELTESTLAENSEDSIKSLTALKDIGVKIVIDGYGTGNLSLSDLKLLPLDGIKIDRSFIAEIALNQQDAAITKTIIGLAHNLSLKVIAEGVEEPAQLEFLREHGCDYYQGSYCSKPLPPDKFTQLAETIQFLSHE